MPRFAANLSMLFTELPFPERFAAAARSGFEAVEFLFPYDHAPEEMASWLRAAKLRNVLFNMPPGAWETGERGIASIPGREAELAAGVARAIEYAKPLGTPRIHAMAGICPESADRNELERVYVANLRQAARALAPHGLELLIEPINGRDMPNYFLQHQDQALEFLARVDEPNLKIQMDLYHAQIMDGDLSVRLRKQFDQVGHIQIAGVPQRHEPDTGEVNHAYLLALLDELGYGGWVGCEYRPRAGTVGGLKWLDAYSRKEEQCMS